MSHRDCPRFERLVDFARGEQASDEAETIRAHALFCSGCQEEIDEIESVLAAARAGGIAPPADFPARVLRALRASGKGRCGVIPLRLLEHLKGELEGEEAARVSTHLEGCSACRTDMRETHAVLMRVRSLPDIDAPAGFADRVLAVARERRASTRTVRAMPALRPATPERRLSWLFLPAAAAACAVLALGAWWAFRPS
ncbi:MAG: zf-HC2 domain-containing protein, partial [Planctomycetota bacterium]